MIKLFKIAVNIILIALVLLGIFVVFSFIPFPGNYKIFTVQSGSMEPAISTGSLIFVKPSAEYRVEDVVTRKTSDPKVTVTHRIVEVKETDGQKFFVTKGDANDAADGEKVFESDVIGKEILAIPLIGYAVAYAKTTAGLILLIIVPSVIIIYDEMNKIKEEIKRKMEAKNKAREAEELTTNENNMSH